MTTTTTKIDVAVLEHAIESALMPGKYIDWRMKGMFVDGLHAAEVEVESLAATDPASAASVYETFIAGINGKMEEFDDDGDMGEVAHGLYIGWIAARQASGAPAAGTIKKIVWWIEHDDYGLAFGIERGDVIRTLNADGLVALAEVAQAKLSSAETLNDDRGRVQQRTWEPILRAAFVAQRNFAHFAAAAEKEGLTPADCETIAEMLAADAKSEEALAWVTKGLALEATKKSWPGPLTKGLGDLHRRLLKALGRYDEALASAWAEYEKHPWEYSYDDLMENVPESERPSWHGRAMAVTDNATLSAVAALLVKCNETARLAARVRATSDADLEHMSHFTTEPIAGALEAEHPDLAARLHAGCGLRVINRGKSRYYDAALINFEKARDCYLRAGMTSRWTALVADVRAAHSRKTGFMPRFERVAAGHKKAKEPSFLERARRKYGPATE